MNVDEFSIVRGERPHCDLAVAVRIWALISLIPSH